MKLPSIETLEEVLRPRFGEQLTTITKENIFFRIFGKDLIIPKGFTSDGASIPKAFRIFANEYDPRWLFAAIVHDYLYRTQFMPRIIADLIFRTILRETAGKTYCFIFYRGVRLGGWSAWTKNKKKGETYPQAKHDLQAHICNNS